MEHNTIKKEDTLGLSTSY